MVIGQVHPYLKTIFVTISWFPVVFVFTDHVYQPCRITGRSMTPTFNPSTDSTSHDIVLIQKFKIKKAGDIQRGDIVMFRSPQEPEKLLTKRVVGIQGDKVFPKNPPYPKSEAIVPRNHIWVEGDNSFHSIDSNQFGPITQGLVLGKVVSIMWPPSRIGSDLSKGGRDARISQVF